MCKPERLAGYRLCIFDADDTLRRTTVSGQPCPRRPGEWELMPNVRQVLTRVDWELEGAPAVGLASNQDQVAYGHLSFEMARDLLRQLALAATGRLLPDAALQLCPHSVESHCDCRKPKAGMLHRIMRYYDVAPGETVFVGNSSTDREAANAAGVDFLEAREVFGWK
jgi:D-glycero-D-manno-heptose 1,7-bisphosphate phosphatase